MIDTAPRRRAFLALGWLLVLSLTTVASGCGGGLGGNPDDAAFCAAWTGLEQSTDTGDARQGFADAIGLVETLRDNAPEAVAVDAEQNLETLREVQELADSYDWDFARLRASPDGDRFTELGQEMAGLNASGPLADHARNVCAGADDPRFKLGCAASSLTSIPMESDPVTPIVTDPDQLADERLATMAPGATKIRRDLDGGGYEYAFIDSAGETTSVIAVGQDERDSWVINDVRACR